MSKRIALISLIAILSGCALHAPISEEIVFADEVKPTKDFPDILRFQSSLTTSHYTSKFSNEYFKYNHFRKDSLYVNKYWLFGISYGGLILTPTENFAIALSPNFILNAGLDMTYHIGDRFYITAVGNYLWNTQVIFQKRILSGKNLKGSIGVAYRHNQFEFVEPNLFGGSTKGADKFFVNMIGLRTAFNISSDDDRMPINIRIITGIYFETSYGTPVFNLGFSLSFTDNLVSFPNSWFW